MWEAYTEGNSDFQPYQIIGKPGLDRAVKGFLHLSDFSIVTSIVQYYSELKQAAIPCHKCRFKRRNPE
jgi:hypothetical protein